MVEEQTQERVIEKIVGSMPPLPPQPSSLLDNFEGLDNIVDLSVKLVETKRHKVYDMVYLLLKLILLLPVATASVERVFSALVIVKTKSRNKIGDTVLDDCLVTFIERDIFFQVNEDDIMETFMSLRKRRINK